MKPAKFRYCSPTNVKDALTLVSTQDDDTRFLAGGQSLVPMMNFRVATPSVLIDLNRISKLKNVVIDETGRLHIGAMIRIRQLETDPVIANSNPLLAEATKHIAHVQIRNRATLGGSLAHADPAAELPGITLACDAEIHLQGENVSRVISATNFFEGVFSTALMKKEIITKIIFPAWPIGRHWSFQEIARREGDFALVGIAAWFDVNTAGKISETRITAIGAGDRPLRLISAEAVLTGEVPTSELFETVATAAMQDVDPAGDIHASIAYRREVAGVLVTRVLSEAWTRG
ncbi:MAG: xanthine dehydrogenase family protein subunit M [Pseudomonadota bacterium]|nr:xanthine dehydrogenase family protein subunit M [Pseudomonadota bacterium]